MRKVNNTYCLDHSDEPQRLEDQTKTFNYQLSAELQLMALQIHSGENILDAGCGTGVLGRELCKFFPSENFNIEGLDSSEFSLQRARAENEQQGVSSRIKLTHGSLLDLKQKEKYSKIFCRYVLQHIPAKERLQVVKNLWDCLKVGGQLYLIDSYGLLSNIDTKNVWLREKIDKLEKIAPFDLNIGLKLRGMLLDCGVPEKDIVTMASPYNFENSRFRKDEAKNWEQRFHNAQDLLLSLLGEADGHRFFKEYIAEFLNPRTLVLAQKIFVKAIKR